jgi:hypothetical protein
MADQATESRLDDLRRSTAAWISAADTKATALLAICGASLALAVPAMTATASKVQMPVLAGLAAFAAVDLLGGIAALVALWPRTDRMRLLGAHLKPLPRSYSYFGDLGELTFIEFSKHMAGADAESFEKDRVEQTYLLCKIAATKMTWMRRAVIAVGGALVVLTVTFWIAALAG